MWSAAPWRRFLFLSRKERKDRKEIFKTSRTLRTWREALQSFAPHAHSAEIETAPDRVRFLKLRGSASPREVFPGVPPKILSRKERKDRKEIFKTSRTLRTLREAFSAVNNVFKILIVV